MSEARGIGLYLVEQFDDTPPLVEMVELKRQRDEWRHRTEVAEAYVQDMTCVCPTPPVLTIAGVDYRLPLRACDKHRLLEILGGDW